MTLETYVSTETEKKCVFVVRSVGRAPGECFFSARFVHCCFRKKNIHLPDKGFVLFLLRRRHQVKVTTEVEQIRPFLFRRAPIAIGSKYTIEFSGPPIWPLRHSI